MKIALHPDIPGKVAETVLITGSIRSGTTMMWQLMATLDKFECFQEPTLTYPLIPIIDDTPEDIWRLIFEAYLYEDCFIQSLAGRRLNLNRHDMSSSYNILPQEEIDRRLSKSYRRLELAPISEDFRVGFKMPEILPHLDKFLSYYPTIQTVLMVRKPESVIASILNKGYYSDEQMKGAVHTGEWLFRRGHDALLPPWMPDEYADQWADMKEVERAALCYIEQYRHVTERTDCIFVDYDRFVHDPVRQFNAIIEKVGLSYGPLTQDRLDKVHEPEKDRTIPTDDIRPELRDRMADIHAHMVTKTLSI